MFFKVRFRIYIRSSYFETDEDIFVIKRVAMQILAEFIGRQKIRLVGIGVSRLRERDKRQTLITDSKGSCTLLVFSFPLLFGFSFSVI